MVHGKNRIPYWIDRRLTGLAGPEYHAIISFGLPIEPEDSQYGKYRVNSLRPRSYWAPASTKIPTIETLPCETAVCRRVLPSASLALTSAPPATRISTIEILPPRIAR